jgi:hypothetical protein
MKLRFRTRKEVYFRRIPLAKMVFPYIHWQVRNLTFEMDHDFDNVSYVFQFRFRYLIILFNWLSGSGEYRRLWEIGWKELK